ncbi:MAG: SRPBCC family protein [Phycisphaeraceae bacterium]
MDSTLSETGTRPTPSPPVAERPGRPEPARRTLEPVEHGEAGSRVNVGLAERASSALVGLVLVGTGLAMLLRGRAMLGLGAAVSGATLTYRGVSGHCPGYQALGVGPAQSTVGSHPLNRFIHVHDRLRINRSAAELYAHWHDLENLPSLMRHLRHVEKLDNGWSRWSIAGPGGRSVQWDAKIVEDRPNEMIAWRSADDAAVPNHGHVRFESIPHGWGAIAEVSLSYRPPAGVVGQMVAAALGESPRQQLHEDLRRFKRIMEAGETPSSAEQPRGRCI